MTERPGQPFGLYERRRKGGSLEDSGSDERGRRPGDEPRADLRLAATGAIRKAFASDPGAFDPRFYLKPARAAMQEVVKERMEAFGQAGHAGDYEPIPLEEMATRYKEQGHQLTVT